MGRTADSGFSLLEVVIALGLLSAVLISISGLFVLAAQQVAGGRSSSQALAAARSILEETGCWTLQQTYRLFGFDGSAPGYTVDTRTNAFAARWRPMVEPGLSTGAATLRIESLGPGGSPPALNASRAIRVRVTVSWDEGARRRAVDLVAVRM